MTPGLIYAEAGNGLPVCSLRGIGFFSTSLGSRPTVSVYIDEAPISPATPLFPADRKQDEKYGHNRPT